MNKEERADEARRLHRSGCNCCQAVVLAYADRLPIGTNQAADMAAPFGRGLGCREVCGCVSGMAMVCGLTNKADKVPQLIAQFRTDNGDVVCARLLQMGKRPCRELVAYTAQMMADTIE